MLDNRVIQVQRMPRTRLGTCSNESQPCHEWPLLASETSLWDLSRWTMDAMIDRVMDQPIFANFWLANRAKQRHNYVAQIVKQPRCAISEKPMYCDLCEPNGTTWDNLQSMLSLLLMSTSGLPLPMGYQWTTYRAWLVVKDVLCCNRILCFLHEMWTLLRKYCSQSNREGNSSQSLRSI